MVCHCIRSQTEKSQFHYSQQRRQTGAREMQTDLFAKSEDL